MGGAEISGQAAGDAHSMKQLGLNLHKTKKAYQGYTLISPMEGTITYLILHAGPLIRPQWVVQCDLLRRKLQNQMPGILSR